MKRILLLCCASIIIFSSCGGNDPSIIKNENLFKLRYGKMDDQLDMSYSRSDIVSNPALVRMSSGIIYVMNGNLRKIMKFNSYGDILAVIGKRENAGGSLLVEENANNEERVNRKAVFFPFNNIETMAVDSRQYIYVSDLLPQERHEWDEKKNVMLSNIIYRFDNNCNYIDSLGQDGRGGIPFPFIKNILTNSRNEIVVVTLTSEGHTVYWFNENGELLYRIELDQRLFPVPQGEKNLEASLETIRIPDNDRLLFIKTDYLEKNINEATGVQTDIDFYKSYINILDVVTGKFISMIEIPDVYTASAIQGNFMDKRLQVIYSLLDVINDKYIFLSSIINNKTLQILVLGTDGKVAEQSRLNIDFENYFHVDIDISNEGIITALMASGSEALLSWWRTDSLLRVKK